VGLLVFRSSQLGPATDDEVSKDLAQSEADHDYLENGISFEPSLEGHVLQVLLQSNLDDLLAFVLDDFTIVAVRGVAELRKDSELGLSRVFGLEINGEEVTLTSFQNAGVGREIINRSSLWSFCANQDCLTVVQLVHFDEFEELGVRADLGEGALANDAALVHEDDAVGQVQEIDCVSYEHSRLVT